MRQLKASGEALGESLSSPESLLLGFLLILFAARDSQGVFNLFFGHFFVRTGHLHNQQRFGLWSNLEGRHEVEIPRDRRKINLSRYLN